MRAHPRTASRRPAQQGVVAIMFALMLFVLMGFAGLALDSGRLYVNKAELQNAADACALAAAQEIDPAGTPDFTKAHAAGVLVAKRHRSDFQSRSLDEGDVTVDFAAKATSSAGDWHLAAAAQSTDFVARCTLKPVPLSLWIMPMLGLAPAKVTVTAEAAASRDIADNNCAPGPGNCKAQASLLQ